MFNSVLLFSNGFKVTSNEQIDQLSPFFVSLQSSSQNHHFSSEHPEDSGDGFGNSVVARNNDINVLKRSISVAKSNGGNVDIGCLDDGLVVALGISNNKESGFLEFFSDLIGQSSGDPS